MTPEELSRRHPQLFHVTLPGAWEGICRHGLLSTSRLLDLFEVAPDWRVLLERVRRPAAVALHHAVHGAAVLNDQSPMTEAALARCLDDGLAAADWLMSLNRRVFFWADGAGLDRLLHARANRVRACMVLVVDTLGLAEAYAERIELSAINSGATLRKPARRGLATFTPLTALPYEEWQRQRGGRDRILEVTVLDGVPDLGRFVTEVRQVLPDLKRARPGRSGELATRRDELI